MVNVNLEWWFSELQTKIVNVPSAHHSPLPRAHAGDSCCRRRLTYQHGAELLSARRSHSGRHCTGLGRVLECHTTIPSSSRSPPRAEGLFGPRTLVWPLLRQ